MTKGLARAWRVVATGLCFTVFGVGGVLVAVGVFPAVALLVHPAERRKAVGQWVIGRGFAVFTGLMQFSGVLTCEIHGRTGLQRPGCIVVANHPSLIDVVVLLASMPRADCIVKERLWRNPVTGGPVRLAGYIRNTGGPELIERCRASLAAGNRLIVFPEGTRTDPGGPLRFQRGAANIAVHAGADVVPVTLRLSETTLTKEHRWYQVPRRRLHVTLEVDEPIRVAPYLSQYPGKPLAARRLTEHLRQYYAERLRGTGSGPAREVFLQPAG